MNFFDAMKLLSEDKRVRRQGWEIGFPREKQCWLQLDLYHTLGSMVYVHRLDELVCEYRIFGCDLVADDWEEIDSL